MIPVCCPDPPAVRSGGRTARGQARAPAGPGLSAVVAVVNGLLEGGEADTATALDINQHGPVTMCESTNVREPPICTTGGVRLVLSMARRSGRSAFLSAALPVLAGCRRVGSRVLCAVGGAGCRRQGVARGTVADGQSVDPWPGDPVGVGGLADRAVFGCDGFARGTFARCNGKVRAPIRRRLSGRCARRVPGLVPSLAGYGGQLCDASPLRPPGWPGRVVRPAPPSQAGFQSAAG